MVESDEGKERPGKRREHDAQRFQVNLHGGLSLSLSLSGGGCSEEKGRKNVVSETGSFLKCLKRLKNPKFIREKKKTVEKTHDRGKT